MSAKILKGSESYVNKGELYNKPGEVYPFWYDIEDSDMNDKIETSEWDFKELEVNPLIFSMLKCEYALDINDNLYMDILSSNIRWSKSSFFSHSNKFIKMRGFKTYKKIRHEITLSGISGLLFESDVSLISVSKYVSTIDKDLSPDLIYSDDKRIIILELKTTKTDDGYYIVRKALSKYLSPLREMRKNGETRQIILHAVCVSENKVWTTFKFKKDYTGLCDLFKIGYILEIFLTKEGIKIDDNDENDKFYDDFMSSLKTQSQINLLDGKIKGFITNSMVKNWSNFDKQTLRDKVEKILIKSNKEAINEINDSMMDRERLLREKVAFDKFDSVKHSYDSQEMTKFSDEWNRLSQQLWKTGDSFGQKKKNLDNVLHFPLLTRLECDSELTKLDVDDAIHYLPAPTTDSPHTRIWEMAINNLKDSMKKFPKINVQDKIDQVIKQGYYGSMRDYSGGDFMPEHKKDIRKNQSEDKRKATREITLELKKLNYLRAKMDKEKFEKEHGEKLKETRRKLKENRAFDTTLDYESIEQSQNLKQEAVRRNQRSRVTVNLSLNDRQELAKRGFQAKAFKNNPNLENHKIKSKVPFDFETKTSDISDCIDDEDWWFSPVNNASYGIDKELEDIFYEAIKDCPGSTANFYNKNIEEINEFSKTRLSNFAHLNDLIIEEINISLTQYCAKDELILKKIDNHDIWLLIKPTRPDRQIFYSILFHKSYHEDDKWGRVFMDVHKYNDSYLYIKFCSLNRNRISHLLFSRELLLCIYGDWLEMSKSILQTQDRSKRLSTAKKHVICSLILNYETKTRSVETALLSRYMYMESTNNTLMRKNNTKIISKFFPFPRSRFTLFIMKRITYVAIKMKYYPPKSNAVSNILDIDQKKAERASDNFKDIISWMTLDELDSYKKVLFCSYIGVMHNKDEGDEHQGNYKIMTKIADEEIKMNNDNEDNIGWKDPEECKSHEFSPSYVKSCGESVRKYIEQETGSFSTWFKTEILRMMSSRRWEEIATLKASAVKNDSYVYELTEKEMNLRTRALEGVLSIIRNRKQGSSPAFRNLQELVDILGDNYEKEEILNKFSTEDLKDMEYEAEYRKFYEQQETTDRKFGKSTYSHKDNEAMYEVVTNIEDPMIFAMEAISFIENREKGVINRREVSDTDEKYFLSNLGGVHSNLFKKQQLTGPREIFVLDILSRVVILFVETVSRTINQRLPWEMLTKGTKKISRSEDHYKQLELLKLTKGFDEDVTSIDSLDKTTWCQLFTMPAFACFYNGLLDEKDDFEKGMLNLIFRVFNLVANKRLEVPKGMLDDFIDNSKKGIRSMTDSTNLMKDEFRGDSKTCILMRIHRVYLMNVSNFMQGINHYTSSLYHAGHALYMMKLSKKIGLFLCDKNLKDRSYYMPETWKVSSDDSSIIRTILIRTVGLDSNQISQLRMKAAMIMTFISILEKNLAREACMVLSVPKSTCCNLSGIEEFNSIWLVRNTIIMPRIKFIYAALKPKVTAMMEDRERTFSELRKQIMENCGSFYLNGYIMISQFLIHYRLLGSRSGNAFKYYKQLILNLKSPSLGWLPIDVANFCGCFGYNISLQNTLEMSKQSRLTSDWIYRTRGTTATEEGKPSIKISLVIGSRSRYLKFLNNIGVPENFEMIAETKPWCLLRKSKTVLESLFHIYKKAMTPSTSEAFSFQPGSKMHAAASFILLNASMSWREKIDNVWSNTWNSLIGFCFQACREIYGKDQIIFDKKSDQFLLSDNKEDVNILKIKTLLFPSLSNQTEIIKIAENLSTATIVEIDRLATRQISLTSPMMVERSHITFEENVKRLWFKNKVRTNGTNSEHEYAYIFFNNLYPWYKRSYKDTIDNLEELPFNGFITMFDFIKSQTEKAPIIKIASPIRRHLPNSKTITGIMKYNYADGYMLKFNKVRVRFVTEFLNKILLMITRFCSSYEAMLPDNLVYLNLLLLKHFRDSQKMSLDVMLAERCSDTEFMAYLILRCSSGNKQLNFNEVRSITNFLRKGIIFGFVENQHFNRESMKYEGHGVIGFIIDSSYLEVRIYDSNVNEIVTNDERILSMVGLRIVRSLLKMKLIYMPNKIGQSKRSEFKSTVFLDLNGMLISRRSTQCVPVVVDPTLKQFDFDGIIKMKLLWGKGIKIYQELYDRKVTIGFLSCNYNLERNEKIELELEPSIAKHFNSITLDYISGNEVSLDSILMVFNNCVGSTIIEMITNIPDNKRINCYDLGLQLNYIQNVLKINKQYRDLTSKRWQEINMERDEIQRLRLMINRPWNKNKDNTGTLKLIYEKENKVMRDIYEYKNYSEKFYIEGTLDVNLNRINMPIRKYVMTRWINRFCLEVIANSVGTELSLSDRTKNMNFSKNIINYNGSEFRFNKPSKEIIGFELIEKIITSEEIISQRKILKEKEVEEFIRNTYRIPNEEDIFEVISWAEYDVLCELSEDEADPTNNPNDEISEYYIEQLEGDEIISLSNENTIVRQWEDYIKTTNKDILVLRQILDLICGMNQDLANINYQFDTIYTMSELQGFLITFDHILQNDQIHRANVAGLVCSTFLKSDSTSDESDGESLVSVSLIKDINVAVINFDFHNLINNLNFDTDEMIREFEYKKAKPLISNETRGPFFLRSKKTFDNYLKEIDSRNRLDSILKFNQLSYSETDSYNKLVLLSGKSLYRHKTVKQMLAAESTLESNEV